MANIVTVTPAATLPVTTTALASHLKLGALDGDQTATLAALIAAAVDYIEGQTGRALAAATYRESFTAPRLRDDPMILRLLRGPVTAVTGITYWPADGSAQVTLVASPAAAMLPPLADMLPGALLLTADALALDLAKRPDALAVTYQAGSSTSCPPSLRHGILLLAALWYEEGLPVNIDNIVNELPFGLQNLINSHRVGGWSA